VRLGGMTMRRILCAFVLLLVASFMIVPCQSAFAGASEQGEGIRLEAGTGDRKGVSLTVYNSDIALVRDTRIIQFSRGLNLVELSGLAPKMDPTSISFTSLTDPKALKTTEHNFDYAVVSRQTLLERYIGEEIWLIADGIRMSARLISVDGQGRLIVDVDGRIILDPPGSIELPSLSSRLITRPTLVWHAEAEWTRRHEVEITYLTTGLNWSADYVCILDNTDKSCALTGWVTLDNKSGATYRDAKLKLIAGNIHRLPVALPVRGVKETMMVSESLTDAEVAFEEKPGFEYHTYTLSGTTTVANNQLKQIQLLGAPYVSTKKLYFFESSGYRYAYDSSLYPGQSETKNAKTVLEFVNNEASGLGRPLPAGRVRVYKAWSDGSMDLIGEDTISHTPKDETVRLYIGDAFDVVGERIVTDFKVVEKSREEAYCIKVRNRKDEDIDVAVVEKLYGDWTISSPVPYEKRDANTAVFQVRVPRNSEVEILFRVHTKIK
jgi:hypothetical protein